MTDIAYQVECAGRDNDIEAGTLHFARLNQETDRVLTALCAIDWSDRTVPLQSGATPNT